MLDQVSTYTLPSGPRVLVWTQGLPWRAWATCAQAFAGRKTMTASAAAATASAAAAEPITSLDRHRRERRSGPKWSRTSDRRLDTNSGRGATAGSPASAIRRRCSCSSSSGVMLVEYRWVHVFRLPWDSRSRAEATPGAGRGLERAMTRPPWPTARCGPRSPLQTVPRRICLEALAGGRCRDNRGPPGTTSARSPQFEQVEGRQGLAQVRSVCCVGHLIRDAAMMMERTVTRYA